MRRNAFGFWRSPGTCKEATLSYDAYQASSGIKSSRVRAATYIDGDAGVLHYCGYPIEQLVPLIPPQVYLLVYGVLPSCTQLTHFEGEVMSHSLVHADAEG